MRRNFTVCHRYQCCWLFSSTTIEWNKWKNTKYAQPCNRKWKLLADFQWPAGSETMNRAIPMYYTLVYIHIHIRISINSTQTIALHFHAISNGFLFLYFVCLSFEKLPVGVYTSERDAVCAPEEKRKEHRMSRVESWHSRVIRVGCGKHDNGSETRKEKKKKTKKNRKE